MGLLKLGRCPICEWPLSATEADGCTLDNCSYRPHEGTDEYYRIRDRREQLARLKKETAASNAFMDELEREVVGKPIC